MDADAIREYIIKNLIVPAKARGKTEISIRAGDLHRKLGLANRYPAVCSALRGAKLQQQAEVTLSQIEGPSNGANVWFHFDLSKIPSRILLPASKPRRPQIHDGELDWRGALVLISCTKTKMPHEAMARDLYLGSAAFRMKRELAEKNLAEYVILSAKYGVVEPTTRIQPYDLTLNTLSTATRRHWASAVIPIVAEKAKAHRKIVTLAGERYTEYLIPALRAKGIPVEEPMKGLRQGEQLSWLSNRL